MSNNAFLQSPARGFLQSQCRARRTRAGFLVFQFLTCDVFAHNTDGTPWGFHAGQDVDAAWPDPMGATFYNGPFGSLGGNGTGGDSEFWEAAIHPSGPNDPFLRRSLIINNPAFLPHGVKDGFGWRFTRTGFDHRYTILTCFRQLVDYLPFTDIFGTSWPGGTWERLADRIRIYPAASGCATFHTMSFDPRNATYNGGLTSPITIPAPHRTETRNTGDPMQEYFPDAPTTAQLDTVFPGSSTVSGITEICLFWFERTPDDLPAFPYLLDPSTL